MKWSQLKKRVEDSLAPSIQGRVEFWLTCYRKSHDRIGEAWITMDKVRVACMGTETYFKGYYGTAYKLQEEQNCMDYHDPAKREAYYKAYEISQNLMEERGIFSAGQFTCDMFSFLSLSIDDALASQSPVIRGLAVLDRRFGKRRILQFDATKEHPLVAMLFEIRRKAEGIIPSGNSR